MFALIAAERDPEKRVVAVFKCPVSNLGRYRSGVLAVEIHVSRGVGAVRWIKEHGRHAERCRRRRAQYSAPVPTADADAPQAVGEGCEPIVDITVLRNSILIVQLNLITANPMPALAQHGALAMHAAIALEIRHLSCYAARLAAHKHPILHNPWATARIATEAATDPNRDAPHPPARNLRIEVIGIAFESGGELLASRLQPGMAGVEIVLVHRPIGIVRYGFGIPAWLNSAPKVADKAVEIVGSLIGACAAGPVEQHGAGPKERLDIILDIGAEALPDVGRDTGFPTKTMGRVL